VALARFRQEVLSPLTGRELAGPRLDTLVCDALLPLVAAVRDDDRLSWLWWNWFPGDLPVQVFRTLGALGLVGPGRPRVHGLAQGLLGWRIAHEGSEAAASTSPETRPRSGERGLTTETADR
jgi:hypothetical protein